MSKAEEYANQITQHGTLRWDADKDSIIRMLESYGRLVQEAAAKEIESECWNDGHRMVNEKEKAHIVANFVRNHVKLP